MWFLIIVAYHYLWTLHQWKIAQIVLKMLPITYWNWKRFQPHLLGYWIGDAGLLIPGHLGLAIGMLGFTLAHSWEIGYQLQFINPEPEFLLWIALLGWTLPASNLKFIYVFYGIIVGLNVHLTFLNSRNLWTRFGMLLMTLSDILIGLDLIWDYRLPYQDTWTLGLYWMGLWCRI